MLRLGAGPFEHPSDSFATIWAAIFPHERFTHDQITVTDVPHMPWNGVPAFLYLLTYLQACRLPAPFSIAEHT